MIMQIEDEDVVVGDIVYEVIGSDGDLMSELMMLVRDAGRVELVIVGDGIGRIETQ